MKIQVEKGRLIDFTSEAVIITLFEEVKILEGEAAILDDASNGLIQSVLEKGDFEGKINQIVVLYTKETTPVKRIVLAGLGKISEFNMEKVRVAFATASKHIRSLNIREISTSFDDFSGEYSLDQIVNSAIEGLILGLYRFSYFKTIDKDNEKTIDKFRIVSNNGNLIKTIKSSVKRAETISRAVCFARDMISMPANEMTPSDMTKRARMIAKGRSVKLKVYEEADMKKLGMNALLAVARGSDQPPKFIVLEYRGASESDPFVVLVGKGITFDSGGISIKPADKMDEMKTDMAGGAAVMSAIMAASELRIKLNVATLIPATENLIGGSALKPGDIVRSLSGKTIEIISTDAEGRLILADALTYAKKYDPRAIIDMATLTGACVIALGESVSGIFGNNDDWIRRVRNAAEATGEKVWQMPLWEEYHELIKSDVADFKNAAGRAGGAITAAVFLSKFVDQIPWVHIDIAGTAFSSKDKAYIPKGATGVGVRLLVQILTELADEVMNK